MRRVIRRFLPFTTWAGAAWWGMRNRDFVLPWLVWGVRSPFKVLRSETQDVIVEAKLQARLQHVQRTRRKVDVRVDDGVAELLGNGRPDCRPSGRRHGVRRRCGRCARSGRGRGGRLNPCALCSTGAVRPLVRPLEACRLAGGGTTDGRSRRASARRRRRRAG